MIQKKKETILKIYFTLPWRSDNPKLSFIQANSKLWANHHSVFAWECQETPSSWSVALWELGEQRECWTKFHHQTFIPLTFELTFIAATVGMGVRYKDNHVLCNVLQNAENLSFCGLYSSKISRPALNTVSDACEQNMSAKKARVWKTRNLRISMFYRCQY